MEVKTFRARSMQEALRQIRPQRVADLTRPDSRWWGSRASGQDFSQSVTRFEAMGFCYCSWSVLMMVLVVLMLMVTITGIAPDCGLECLSAAVRQLQAEHDTVVLTQCPEWTEQHQVHAPGFKQHGVPGWNRQAPDGQHPGHPLFDHRTMQFNAIEVAAADCLDMNRAGAAIIQCQVAGQYAGARGRLAYPGIMDRNSRFRRRHPAGEQAQR